MAEGLPAITVWQPWASLIALGVKTIETRSWPAPDRLVGQRIGIHAARRPPEVHGFQRMARIGDWWIEADGLGGYQTHHRDDLESPGHPLPLGVLLGTARLAACVPMVGQDDPVGRQPHLIVGTRYDPARLVLCIPSESHYSGGAISGKVSDWSNQIVTDQAPFGDFAPGRWAWLLDEITPTTDRCLACDGDGGEIVGSWGGGVVEDRRCPTCDGAGRCDPIPAKGAQRVWYWRPAPDRGDER